MSFPLSPPRHPVLACAATLGAALDDVADVEPIFMATCDKQTALVELAAAAVRLDELRLRVLGAADDVAEAHGSRDAGAWLAFETRLDDAAGRRDLELARMLEHRPALARAMRSGSVDRARIVVVARALDELPDDLPPAVSAAAEQHFVDQAPHFTPRELRNLGRKLLSVVAPDLDDERERRALEDEDARAAAQTSLHTRRRGDGTTDIRIRCADHVADRLLAYLESFTSPRQHRGGRTTSTDADETQADETPETPGAPDPTDAGSADRRPYPQRLGEAFGSLLEHLDPSRLPLHGGDATTIIVTMDLTSLLEGLGVALVGDEPLSAAQARRLACTARLVPAVLGGESEILDLGRGRRLYNRPQRKAMAVRDVTCRARGCTIPAAWCEAHHLTPWSQGGSTDLDDGVLLCGHHHHRAHDTRYDLVRHPDGTITFHRRPDPPRQTG